MTEVIAADVVVVADDCTASLALHADALVFRCAGIAIATRSINWREVALRGVHVEVALGARIVVVAHLAGVDVQVCVCVVEWVEGSPDRVEDGEGHVDDVDCPIAVVVRLRGIPAEAGGHCAHLSVEVPEGREDVALNVDNVRVPVAVDVPERGNGQCRGRRQNRGRHGQDCRQLFHLSFLRECHRV